MTDDETNRTETRPAAHCPRESGFYRLRWRAGRMAVGFLHPREENRDPREHWSVLFTHDTETCLSAAYTRTRDISEEDIGERIAEHDQAAKQIAELEETCDLRWKADMRAIGQWRKEAPGRELKWPDHTELVVWLLEKLEAAGVQI